MINHYLRHICRRGGLLDLPPDQPVAPAGVLVAQRGPGLGLDRVEAGAEERVEQVEEAALEGVGAAGADVVGQVADLLPTQGEKVRTIA